MSWESGNYSHIKPPDSMEFFRNLKGNLSEEQARILIYRFFRSNLGLAAYVLMGVDLYAIQEVVLKMMFNRDFVLGVCTRGFSKSFLGGVFAGLYALLEPGNKILLAGPSFKQAKFVFQYMEKFANSPKGYFFRECFAGKVSHLNEEWKVQIGLPGMESEICALPLGQGDKIRGYRGNVLIVDELGSIPPDIVKEVLKPFLIVNKDPRQMSKVMEEEDELIKRGKMKESERTRFQQPKIISLSSATFSFEDLNETFKAYVKAILEPADKVDGTYGIFQIGSDALPRGYINEIQLAEHKRTMSESQFKREYGAQFTDDSSGYFRMSQMEACTLTIGQVPTIQFRGSKDKAYIVSLDPNYKESEDSDNFSMAVSELDIATKKAYLVHNYAIAGQTLKEHIKYLHYLLTHFNVVYIIGDASGLEQVITFANENELFKESKIELKYFEAEYDDADKIRTAKRTYNKSTWSIVHKQNFTSDWIASANQLLQANFQHKRMMFGANLFDDTYEAAMKLNLPLDQLIFDSDDPKYDDNREKMIAFVDTQTRLMKMTKEECALIEVDITPLGTQTFKLPQSIRRGAQGKKRARKDSYTSLLLNNYAATFCWPMLVETQEVRANTFVPIAMPL